MARSNIILTGFMGTGKSTVGKLLAEQLDYEFVDTDELIQSRTGQTIPEIFREQGEAAFRGMEAAVARELGEKEGMVIATGGRMMLDAANAEALCRRGQVFCLVATPEEILQRVSADACFERPLLESPNPMERIVELMQERKAGYGRFTQLITSGKSPAEVAGELLKIFHGNADDAVKTADSSPLVERDQGAGG